MTSYGTYKFFVLNPLLLSSVILNRLLIMGVTSSEAGFKHAQMCVLDSSGHCTVCPQYLVVIRCTVWRLLGTAQVFQEGMPNGQIRNW